MRPSCFSEDFVLATEASIGNVYVKMACSLIAVRKGGPLHV